jgi:hypothetical protein
MTRNGSETVEDRFEAFVLEQYDDVLQACYILFSILNRHLERLGVAQADDLNRIAYKSKLQSIWAFPQMEMICQNISGLARAVDVLCSAFQSYVGQVSLSDRNANFGPGNLH